MKLESWKVGVGGIYSTHYDNMPMQYYINTTFLRG